MKTIPELVRSVFTAYQTGDRALLESLIGEPFSFSSPYDDHIDRATYFERCWPNHESIRAFRIETLLANEAEALVVYEAEGKSGERFRNAELHVFDGEKLARVEVFFGDPPSGVAKKEYQRFIEAGRTAFRPG